MRRVVLIADDSALVRITVTRRVRAAGLEVEERDSVASARGIDPSTLSCALLDYDLGDGFGVAIAEDLRDKSASIPIAFFTSTDTSEVEQAAKFGPVFKKPEELDAAIEWVTKNASASE